jgi:hypothetical protein
MPAVIYDGPSLLDHRTPIVVLLTGLSKKSSNRKTGNMLQTWILLKNQNPLDGIRDGIDAAICGNCAHRGNGLKGRTCYVVPFLGPLGAWKGTRTPADIDTVAKGRYVRLGAYGDPAAVPFEIWERLTNNCLGWTGYTHQWRTCDQRLRWLVMASVESIAERDQAKAMGWRTFRVGHGSENKEGLMEMQCPASEEAGKKLTCNECLYCAGITKFKGDVFIRAHGAGKGIFNRRVVPIIPKTAQVPLLAGLHP